MKWKIIKSEICFQGYFRIDRHHIKHDRFDGGEQTIVREIFERGHAVGVLPYDPVQDEVVLIEQFRPGAVAAGEEPWLIELIAGIIDESELSEDVAKREAREEANCRIDKLISIYSYLVSPGGTSETMTLYCAPIQTQKLGGHYGLAEEGEDIKVHVYKRETAMDLLATGKVNNAMTIIALQWLQVNYKKLQMSKSVVIKSLA